MVVHAYPCLFTGIILVQIHTGILTWNGTGIFMSIQVYSCSLNFRKAGVDLKMHAFLAFKVFLRNIVSVNIHITGH